MFALNREEGDTIEYKDTLVNDDDAVIDDDDIDDNDDDIDDNDDVDVDDDVIDGDVIDVDDVVVDVNDDNDDVVAVDNVVIDVDVNGVAIPFVLTAGAWQFTLEAQLHCWSVLSKRVVLGQVNKILKAPDVPVLTHQTY